jgi:hypothetical protein
MRKLAKTHQRLFLSHLGHTVGWADGLGIEPIARRVLVTKAQLDLTLQANHQTKQRYDTGQGLTLRARLSDDINE